MNCTLTCPMVAGRSPVWYKLLRERYRFGGFWLGDHHRLDVSAIKPRGCPAMNELTYRLGPPSPIDHRKTWSIAITTKITISQSINQSNPSVIHKSHIAISVYPTISPRFPNLTMLYIPCISGRFLSLPRYSPAQRARSFWAQASLAKNGSSSTNCSSGTSEVRKELGQFATGVWGHTPDFEPWVSVPISTKLVQNQKSEWQEKGHILNHEFLGLKNQGLKPCFSRQLRGETTTNFGNPGRILDVILIEQLEGQIFKTLLQVVGFFGLCGTHGLNKMETSFRSVQWAPVIGLECGDINWFSAKAHRIYIVYMFRNKNTI